MVKDKILILNISNSADREEICALGRALAIPDRIRIFNLLQKKTMNLNEIAKELDLPISSVSNHINALVQAQMVGVSYQPGPKGHMKLCSEMVTTINIVRSSAENSESSNLYSYEMAVGMFSECRIYGLCGMSGRERLLFSPDNPNNFYRIERREAELVWFSYGYLSYDFPYILNENMQLEEVIFSLEICSEVVYYRNVWPSDITFYINDVELLTYTSPGDFGGRRGVYTPEYWPISSTQFGLLKKISVNASGTYLDDVFQGGPMLKDLNIKPNKPIKFTVRIKEDAKYRGGINIFGKAFGDFPQAIMMTLKTG